MNVLGSKWFLYRENNVASKWIEEHYSEVKSFVRSKGVDENKVEDLIHDMYINMTTREANGDGYRESFDGHPIDVSQFVLASAKRYAANSKYQRGDSDGGTQGGVTYESDTMEEWKQESAGANDIDPIVQAEIMESLRENILKVHEFDNIYGAGLMSVIEAPDILDGVRITKGVTKLFDRTRRVLESHPEIIDDFTDVIKASRIDRVRYYDEVTKVLKKAN